MRLLPYVVVSVIADGAILCDDVGFVVGLLDGCLAGLRRQHGDLHVLSTLDAEQEVQCARAAAAQRQARPAAAAAQRWARQRYSLRRRRRELPLPHATKLRALLVALERAATKSDVLASLGEERDVGG